MNTNIVWMIQVAIGIVFLGSALAKTRNPIKFSNAVADYRVLPAWIAPAFAFFVVAAEMFVGYAHLSGNLLQPATVLALALLVAFSIAVGVNLIRGRQLPCHCFGDQDGELISGRSLARLLLVIIGELSLASNVAHFDPRSSFPSGVASTGDIAATLAGALFLLVSAVWALSAPDLISLFRKQKPLPPPRAALSSAGGPE